ncbi:hypothetical protein CcrC1_gp103 [Caulobacter phage C1]|nr:hypothetical protein CcrC1_gp103 [Caulobacter phage C1]UTU08331.1 hypothetical protein CcrC2_gp103 [Caulobacter phage C2]UTU08851.1 hypothetical protein CcrJ4_gp100 [Caulobacter phage J4]UTU09405.1 hypothetical protein CcrBL47_gp119 [Caulobacter phage BL47]UTU09965.1 hypothetical protein CcrRB23_gp103 [Caulobacter phage RB23]WGN96990.1 hypothetical protein [Bertelyvirus sp.]
MTSQISTERIAQIMREQTLRRLALENPCRPCGALGRVKIDDTEDADGYYETKDCEHCKGRGWFKKTLDEVMAMRFGPEWPTRLTLEQKLRALENRFYNRATWEPKPGDLYTTSRADLELYEVVDVADGHICTRYRTQPDGAISRWPAEEFLAEHTFGHARTHVPNWVIAFS